VLRLRDRPVTLCMWWWVVPSLAEKDRRAVLDAAVLLSECRDPVQLAVVGAEQVRLLLHAEVSAFTCVDLRQRRVDVLITPNVPEYHQAAERASDTLVDNPLPAYWASSAAPSPSRVSDHLSRGEWFATATYSEVLRPMGTPHMLGVPLQDAAAGGPSCAVSRSGSDFSDRDVGIATALQAALVVAHRHVTRMPGTASMQHLAPAAAPVQRPAAALTPREAEVLRFLSAGRTAQAIARSLDVSPGTVRKHLERVYRKLGVQDRLSAVNRGRELGLLGTDAPDGGGRRCR
jgi:DNA-binding CsgD family transcriptional regulator